MRDLEEGISALIAGLLVAAIVAFIGFVICALLAI